jgi:hypothetical protein
MRKINLSKTTDIGCTATAIRRNKFSSGFKFFSILLLVLLVSGKSWGQTTYVWNGSAVTPTSGSNSNITSAAFAATQGNNNGTTTLISTSSASTGYTGASGTSNFGAACKTGVLNTSTSTYFSTTITPATNYKITLNSISLGSRGTSTGPTAITIYSSIDNYATAIGSATVSANSTWALSSISFTGSSLTGATNTAVTLRIYGSSGAGSASANTANWRIDDVSLNVTAVSSANSTDATLSAMTISSGTLTPTFGSGTISYTATVSNAISSITVTPTRNEANASIQAQVNGGGYSSVTSGSSSGSLALNVGSNTIDVLVTAQDGTTTKTYTTTVTRTAAATVSTLDNLVLSDGTLSSTFNSGTTSYTASVPYTTSSITVTPTKTNSFASIQVQVNAGGYSALTSGSPSSSLSLNVGSNTIDVKVTAEDGSFTTYTTTVTRAAVATDATLSALTTTAGALTPTFDAGTTSYTASVDNTTASVTVTPTKTNAFATIQVRVNSGSYSTITSGNASSALALNEGDNTIEVKVTAQDGTTIQTYTITVNRTTASAPTISAVGTLSAVNTTYGTASASPTSFTISGSAMNAGITVTPPAGFEVSTTSGFSSNVGNNTSPITVGSAGTINTTTIYVRLKATATYAGSPYSGNIALTSTGATQVDVATASSTVTRVQLTITGLTGTDKTYDGTTSASFTGTAAYSGLVNTESFSVSGTPIASFETVAVANSKTITITGYDAPSTNYTVANPTITANITAKALTMSGLSVPASKTYDGTTTAIVSGTAALQTAEAPGAGTTDDGKPYTGDVVSIQGTKTGTYNDANVASATTVTFGGLSLTGAQSANYSLTIQGTQSATITKASQTINGVTATASKYVGDSYYLAATSVTSATNPLSYSSLTPEVASIDASTGLITAIAAGTTTFTVSQAASANYNAATDATQVLTVTIAPTLLLSEDFNYANAALLTSNGWSAHSGGGTAAIDVVVPGLTFNGYVGSGVGGAARVDNTGEDLNKTFTPKTNGTIYAAFIISASSTNSSGYFFNLAQDVVGTTYISRVWINGTGTSVGIGTGASVAITANTPTLLVVKYNIDTKLSSLYVLNSMSATEPATADATYTETATLTNVGAVCLRQYNAAQNVIVDGIRVTTTWAELPVTFSGNGFWTETARWNTGTVPGATESAFVDGTATINSNVEVAGLTLNSGKSLTINPGKQLTVSTTLTNNGTLNLKSSASGTATILTPASISGSGTTNVEQYLTSGRNWYISSPLTDAVSSTIVSAIATTTAGYGLQSYKESNATWESAASTLAAKKGYVAKSLASDITLNFTGGTLNTGTQSISLNRTDSAITKRGFNLVGNPYPSYLNWELASRTLVNPTMWYRAKNSGGSSYIFDTYGAVSKVGTSLNGTAVTAYIPPMQAFWVRVTGGGAGTVVFENSMRAHEVGTNRLKAPELNTQKVLRLQVSNVENCDEAIVLFNSNASDSYDDYDSPKMSNANAAIPEIYTTVGGEQLVINGLNSAVIANRELPLGFTTGASNNFTIKATEISNFDADTRVILKDNVLKAEFELNVGNAYSFSSDVVNTTSRFSILFRSATGPNALYDNNFSTLYIGKNANNQITINGVDAKDGMVTVCNAVGQKLISTALTGSSLVIDKPFSTGVYLVTVNVGNAKVTKKVIVN